MRRYYLLFGFPITILGTPQHHNNFKSHKPSFKVATLIENVTTWLLSCGLQSLKSIWPTLSKVHLKKSCKIIKTKNGDKKIIPTLYVLINLVNKEILLKKKSEFLASTLYTCSIGLVWKLQLTLL